MIIPWLYRKKRWKEEKIMADREKPKKTEYSGVIYTANPDVETADSGKTETDIPA